MHPDIVEIVKIFADETPAKDISMTTNGTFLAKFAEKLKDVGLDRVNISCDSYYYNPQYKSLDTIRKSIDIAKDVGLTPIKLNMVMLKGVNEDQVAPMLDFTAENGIILQLIELVDLVDKEYFNKYHMSLRELEKEFEKRAIKIKTRDLHLRHQYTLENGGVVELVEPMHNSTFCMHCQTMRVTNDFQFQPCLYRTDNLVPIKDDLKAALDKAMEHRRPFFV